MPQAPLLEVRGLDVTFGRQRILSGVDLSAPAGSVVAVLGHNGAGKTTLLRAISGLTRPAAGAITYDGENITARDPRSRVDMGIVHMAGGRSVFASLSVLDNLLVGGHRFAWDTARVERRIQAVTSLFPRLGERLDQQAGTLSGGEQHMLALAKALVPEPRLLLVDELALGLAPAVVGDLLRVLGELAADGVTVVLVEQSVAVVTAVADHAVWIDKGSVAFAGRPSELLARPDLTRGVAAAG